MAITEENVTGRKYRIWDSIAEKWKGYSFWTKATDVEMNSSLSLQSALTAEDDLEFNFAKNGDKYGYKDKNGAFVPFKTAHTETKSVTTRGTTDMGVDHSYRYVNTSSVPNSNSSTYIARTRNAALDMGATNSYRYVDTESVPNNNTEVYTITANGTHDMGATNNYRYVTSQVMRSSPTLVGTYSNITYVSLSPYVYYGRKPVISQFLAVCLDHDECTVSYYVEKMDAHPESSSGDYYPPTLAISGDTLIITPASLSGSGAGHSAIKYMATTVYFIG